MGLFDGFGIYAVEEISFGGFEFVELFFGGTGKDSLCDGVVDVVELAANIEKLGFEGFNKRIFFILILDFHNLIGDEFQHIIGKNEIHSIIQNCLLENVLGDMALFRTEEKLVINSCGKNPDAVALQGGFIIGGIVTVAAESVK